MKLKSKMKHILSIIFLASLVITGTAQNRILIDGIIGTVGQETILKSDVENQLLQYKARKMAIPGDDQCYIFEELLFQTLLLKSSHCLYRGHFWHRVGAFVTACRHRVPKRVTSLSAMIESIEYAI